MWFGRKSQTESFTDQFVQKLPVNQMHLPQVRLCGISFDA